MRLDSSAGFHGNDRFLIRRRVGAGGMGIVYDAFDRERGERVALKTMRWADPAALYHLKREFRALADVAHPNLASLFELVADGDEWFFTMEFVDGVDFFLYVRPEGGENAPDPKPPDIARLRSATEQLARGVYTLQQAGIVHRDLKPTNVLVTPDGRVVILDFGLAVEATARATVSEEAGLWGTVAYMAPEQADGVAGPASDWYAVGAMLYEALTGRLPFSGAPSSILHQKFTGSAARPDTLVPGLPADLVDLCMALLERDPGKRLGGADVLHRLGAVEVPAGPASRAAARPAAALVGRATHLSFLDDAFAAVQAGGSAAVFVHGSSGVGKTTLVQEFVDRLSAARGAVVLQGRCYLRESVPYKAFDGVIDSLSRYLRAWSRPRVEGLLFEDTLELTRLFPVLRRVEAIAALPAPMFETQDRLQLKRRAFAALRDLFTRVATSAPLVVYIDDLQWEDEDSAALLEELLRAPGVPGLLFLATFRREELGAHPFLRQHMAGTGGPERRALAVDPLTDAETADLVTQLLEGVPEAARFVGAIARDAEGNPFLVEQMARYVATSDGTVKTSGATLAELVDARVRRLPAGARELLQALAVAGHPLDSRVALRVAGSSGKEGSLLSALFAARLVRSSGARGRVELYHDRLREILTAPLGAEAEEDLHGRLAETLEAEGFDDPEVLFEHYRRTGRRDRTKIHAVRAAQRAAAALAFDRAAMFYRRAIEMSSPDDTDIAGLRTGLGDALADAGRLPAAADAYLGAARLVAPAEALELRRRAAEQLLISGRLDEGMAMLKTVMVAARLRLPGTGTGALLTLVARRVWLRVRGLGFRPRAPGGITREESLRIDVCRTVSEGLAHLEFVQARLFQTQYALLSLRSGDPERVADAISLEAAFASLGGSERARRRAAQLLGQARGLATGSDSARARTLCLLMEGVTAYFAGQWRGAHRSLGQAQQELLEHGRGVAWAIMTARLYQTFALYYLGELRELGRSVDAFLADAAERGNRFAGTIFRTAAANAVWLVADDPEGGRAAMREALAEWPARPFRTPHYLALTAEVRINLYQGAGGAAWDRLNADWPTLRATHLLRIQAIRIVALSLRARAALVAGRERPADRNWLLRVVERDAGKLAREGTDWASAFGALLRAALAAAAGRNADAVKGLREASAGFDRAEMTIYAAATRHRLGELIGGTEGKDLIRQAHDRMMRQGVRNPGRMLNTLAPGFDQPQG